MGAQTRRVLHMLPDSPGNSSQQVCVCVCLSKHNHKTYDLQRFEQPEQQHCFSANDANDAARLSRLQLVNQLQVPVLNMSGVPV